ncbi:MAG: 5-carboxymethyl-2-hydroxymuconate semialdehyde dehydrogenase [Proteobacteria bacterium]|nr:MAG: 5-carboxymethyl-2-hydroxymuconate semialdehyde dehydrogenase [Pseudomonadota bacterium]
MGDTLADNLVRAQGYLERFRSEPLAHFINGRVITGRSGELFDNSTPTDNSVLGTVCAGNAADIDTAAQAARVAFEDWRRVPGSERQQLLHRIADAIVARRDEIALVESMDTGQPIRYMAQAAVRGAENFRFFADRAPAARDGLALPAAEHLNYTLRQPIGPVGVITPWNTPFMLSTWKIAPALAAGCTVVHKPAEWSPYTASLLAEICHEAGLPDGVLNTVHGLGEIAGKALTEHPAIKAIAFVGESNTGSAIMGQGAPTLKRLHAELGGKNPVIVFADADLERALDAVVFMSYSLNGERCTASARVLIQASIYDDFVAAISARAAAVTIGHPLDPAVEMGPLIHRRHFAKVMEYFAIARAEGATIAVGGRPWSRAGQGNYVEPTLFSGATQQMRIAREEIFGPVLTAIPFSDESAALEIANDGPYGLAAYLWTTDIERGHRFARDLDAGMIWVNSENNRHLPSPFGGMKRSGIGRDGGDYSFEFFLETKNICISLGGHKIPRIG